MSDKPSIFDALPGAFRAWDAPKFYDSGPSTVGDLDLSRYFKLRTRVARDRFTSGLQSLRDIRPEGIEHVHALVAKFDGAPVTFRAPEYGSATTRVTLNDDARQRPEIRAAQFVADMTGDRSVLEQLLRPEDIRITGFTLYPLVSDFAYGVALHEFGHASMYAIEGASAASNEVKASQWALDNARYWTRAMSDSLLTGLWTYVFSSDGNPTRHTLDEFNAFATHVADRERRG